MPRYGCWAVFRSKHRMVLLMRFATGSCSAAAVNRKTSRSATGRIGTFTSKPNKLAGAEHRPAPLFLSLFRFPDPALDNRFQQVKRQRALAQQHLMELAHVKFGTE